MDGPFAFLTSLLLQSSTEETKHAEGHAQQQSRGRLGNNGNAEFAVAGQRQVEPVTGEAILETFGDCDFKRISAATFVHGSIDVRFPCLPVQREVSAGPTMTTVAVEERDIIHTGVAIGVEFCDEGGTVDRDLTTVITTKAIDQSPAGKWNRSLVVA